MSKNTVENAFKADMVRIAGQQTEMTEEELRAAFESAVTSLFTFGVPIGQMGVEKSIDSLDSSTDTDED